MNVLPPAAPRAPVLLEDYDPDWQQRYAAEKQLLLGVIGDYLCGSIEHVGSTAVPGLVAKPVIDVMFGVHGLDSSRPAIDILERNGYVYSAYKTDVMHWFCKPSDAYRTHHLHLVPFASPLWHERIRFRDLLRSDAALAREYAALKRDLAVCYREDRERYTQEKWPFIRRVLESSREPRTYGSDRQTIDSKE